MNVRATRMGQYGDRLRRPGEVFTLTDPAHFSATWMVAVVAVPSDGAVVARETTGPEPAVFGTDAPPVARTGVRWVPRHQWRDDDTEPDCRAEFDFLTFNSD